MGSPLRRLAAVCLPALLLPAAALAAGSTHSWAQPQIKLVTKQGLFAGSPATFDASADLTQGALAGALGKLTNAPAAAPSDGVATVSIEQLDRSLVDALGLGDSAYRFRLAATRDGPGLRRLRLLRFRLARLQADRLSGRGQPGRRAARPDDDGDERRGAAREADRRRRARAGGRHVLRAWTAL